MRVFRETLFVKEGNSLTRFYRNSRNLSEKKDSLPKIFRRIFRKIFPELEIEEKIYYKRTVTEPKMKTGLGKELKS